MGKVVLARIDARLTHGQVMTSLSKSAGATAISVADDPAAHNPFTKNVTLGAGSRIGLKVRVLKEDGAVRHWNNRQYGDYHVILLTKSTGVMADIVRGGVPTKELNLDDVPQKPGLTSIIKGIAINKEQLKTLQELKRDYGIDVYFRAIPSLRCVSLEEAAHLFKGYPA